MALFGCDLSDFDWARGAVDVAAMHRDGMNFVIHKATEGTSIRHGHFGQAVGAARTAGVAFIGGYHVVRTPGNGGHGSIGQQVDYLLTYADAAAPWWRQHPGWFWQADTEKWGYDDVSPTLGAQFATLLEQRSGKRCLLYAPAWAYGNSVPGPAPLWASGYPSSAALPWRQLYPGDGAWPGAYSGRQPVIWQFASTAVIAGHPTCDVNAFRGTVDDFTALIGGDVITDADWARMQAMHDDTVNRTSNRDRWGLDHPSARQPGDPWPNITIYDLAVRLDALKAVLDPAALAQAIAAAIPSDVGQLDQAALTTAVETGLRQVLGSLDTPPPAG